jgi:hypothetical protein
MGEWLSWRGLSFVKSVVVMSGTLLLLIAACQPLPEPAQALPTLMDLPTETMTPAPVEQGRIEFWQPVSAEFTDAEALHLWQFDAQSGDRVSLRAVGSGVRVLLKIFAPDGSELPDTTDELLATTGQYLVQVIRIGDAVGSYELGLSYSDQPNPNDATETPLPVVVGVPTPLPVSADLGTFIDELQSGETQGGTLTTEDNRHVYIFKAPLEGYAAVEVTRVNGDLNPFLTIYDPQGRSMAVDGQSDGDGRAMLQNLRINEPEAYYTLQVSGKGFAGSYSVRWTRSDVALSLTPQVEIVSTSVSAELPLVTPELVADEDAEGRLQDHIPLQSLLEDPSDLNRHTFNAEAGEILTAGVIPAEGSALIPYVELYDPDGSLVVGMSGEVSGPSRAAVLPAFTAAMSGPYTLFVTAQGETSGAYTVSYGSGSTLADRVRGDAVIDAPNTSQLVLPGDRDIWTVNLRQGDMVSLSAVGEGLLEPVLELVAENGDLIGIDYNSGGAQRPVINGVTIPRNGRYTIQVRPATPQNLGNYTLTWRYVSVAPTATPPVGTVSLVALEDTISDGEYKFYPFQAQMGQNLRITVAGAPNMNFDPVVSILDPAAAVIAEGDDSQNSLNAIVYLRIPADGTYAVRVNGYLQGGDFSLLVDNLVEVGR